MMQMFVPLSRYTIIVTQHCRVQCSIYASSTYVVVHTAKYKDLTDLDLGYRQFLLLCYMCCCNADRGRVVLRYERQCRSRSEPWQCRVVGYGTKLFSALIDQPGVYAGKQERLMNVLSSLKPPGAM